MKSDERWSRLAPGFHLSVEGLLGKGQRKPLNASSHGAVELFTIHGFQGGMVLAHGFAGSVQEVSMIRRI